MSKDNILFLRARPKVFNIGDFLCTPVHYFDFFCNAHENTYFLKHKEYKVILGGGAFNDLGRNQNIDFKRTVVWALGSSIHGKDSIPTQGDDLPFPLYGLRDPDAVSDQSKVLPCVSCLHPLVQLPPGNETNIFLNYEKVMDLEALTKADELKREGVRIFTNRMNELQFMKVFARTKRVITNSYHFSYWSILSGREVAMIGYSSKFRSLMKLVGLDPRLLTYYDPSSQASLISGIREIMNHQRFHSVSEYSDMRNTFIEKNIQFARKCRDIGFIKDFRMRPNRPLDMLSRNFKYALLHKAAELAGRR